MHKNFKKAFTMIELIFVIIILGILAVTALPKFVGVQDDAKISAENGTAGAVRGAISITHGKWLLNQSQSLDWDGDGTNEIFSSNGYLANIDNGDVHSTAAQTTGIFAEILSSEAEDWTQKTGGDVNGTYEGPASQSGGVPNSGTNELNVTGAWDYNASNGAFLYGVN